MSFQTVELPGLVSGFYSAALAAWINFIQPLAERIAETSLAAF